MAKALGASSSNSDVFDLERIRHMVDLMEERSLFEVELKQGDQQIRLVRGGGQQVMAAPIATQSVAASVAGAPQAAEDGPHIKIIRSPMVGSFYSKANPKADDFVKVGSKVSADTVVCIVEAMKVFNEIPAEVSGTIMAILATNEESVDFGRPLFKVDTRG